VRRHDRTRARADRIGEATGIQVVRASIDVDEHRVKAVRKDHVRGRDERHRRDDYLVAVVPAVELAQRGESALQRAGAAVTKDRVPYVVQRRHQRLEPGSKRAVGEPRALQHLGDVALRALRDASGSDGY
jgi:hypothetical protein